MSQSRTPRQSRPSRPSRPVGEPTGRREGLNLPTPTLVTLLQNLRAYPSVSLLLRTTPGPRMASQDATRLIALARDAQRRLDDEALPGVRSTVIDPLHELVLKAAAGPTSSSIALFASEATTEIVHLPVDVVDRAVVDPTFATRDLVRALHRTPRHVVLALSRSEARLFDGAGDDLRPAQTRAFPRTAFGLPAGPDYPRRALEPEQQRGFLRSVDRALGAYLRVNPAPLVLVGPERTLADFRRLSANTGRLAGCVPGNLLHSSLTDLVPRIRVVLEAYLHSRQEEALALIERRAASGRIASGIAAAWLAARCEPPELLAVEEGFFYPARLDATGDLLSPADDVDHPDVIDDAVDELIEAVLRRGGWIALVEDGALGAHRRVALTLRGSI